MLQMPGGIISSAAADVTVPPPLPPLFPSLIDFGANNTERHYTIPHVAALDGASTGWAWGMFTQVSTNTGVPPLFQFLLSTTLSGPGRIALWMPEQGSSGGGTPNHWTFTLTGDLPGQVNVPTTSANAPQADGLIRLIVLQYNGTAAQLYSCLLGGSAVLLASVTVTLGSVTYPEEISFGARADLAAGRFYDSRAGGLFKASRALTTGEIESIAVEATPVSVLAGVLQGYWAFDRPLTVVPSAVGSANATRWGAWPWDGLVHSRTCQLTTVPGAITGTHTNFPVLFTRANLPAEMFDADGAFPAQNGGGDVRFASDAAGTNLLPAEVVTFVTNNDPALGYAEIWVKLPSISSSPSTTIHVRYHASTIASQPATSAANGRDAVWSQYLLVTHDLITDSTGKFTLTPTGTAACNQPVQPAWRWGQILWRGRVGPGDDEPHGARRATNVPNLGEPDWPWRQ